MTGNFHSIASGIYNFLLWSFGTGREQFGYFVRKYAAGLGIGIGYLMKKTEWLVVVQRSTSNLSAWMLGAHVFSPLTMFTLLQRLLLENGTYCGGNNERPEKYVLWLTQRRFWCFKKFGETIERVDFFTLTFILILNVRISKPIMHWPQEWPSHVTLTWHTSAFDRLFTCGLCGLPSCKSTLVESRF